MTQYIDKATIVEKIKRRFDEYSNNILKYYDACKEAKAQELGKILTILDTLEVKEEVFDTNDIKDAFKGGYDMGVLQTTKKINSNIKEVGLKLNSFDATVCKINNTYLKEMDRNAIVKALEPYKDGDKVKVIIEAQK